jgi:hypothetical protein
VLPLPNLVVDGDSASFTVTNNGGDITQRQPYTVTDANGNVVGEGTF